MPVYVASLQDKAIREVVGGAADGWVPTFWPYRHLRDGRALLDEGARAAGRDPSAIEIAPFVAIVPLADVAAARAMIKPLVSFYIGGMGTYYYYTVGLIFWFRWNTFVGSNLFFKATSRS